MSRPEIIDRRFNERLIDDLFKIFIRAGYVKSSDPEAVSLCVFRLSTALKAFEGDLA